MPETTKDDRSGSEDTCIVSQLVDAVRRVCFLNDQVGLLGYDMDQFVAHFLRHGGTDREVTMVVGDMIAGVEELVVELKKSRKAYHETSGRIVA